MDYTTRADSILQGTLGTTTVSDDAKQEIFEAMWDMDPWGVKPLMGIVEAAPPQPTDEQYAECYVRNTLCFDEEQIRYHVAAKARASRVQSEIAATNEALGRFSGTQDRVPDHVGTMGQSGNPPGGAQNPKN